MAELPIAVLFVPVEFDAKALAPKVVLLATAPPPLPTVRPDIVASLAIVVSWAELIVIAVVGPEPVLSSN
jgi:hypothetical protein